MVEDLIKAQRDLALELRATDRLEEALTLFVDTTMRISEMDAGAIYLVDETSGKLNLVYSTGLSSDFMKDTLRYLASSQNSEMNIQGKSCYATHDELEKIFTEDQLCEGLEIFIIIPALNEGQVVAYLNLASHYYDEIHTTIRDTLETMTAQMGRIIISVRAEETLREREETFRALTEHSHDTIMRFDSNLRHLYVNPIVEKQTGIPPSEFIGKTHTELGFPDNLVELWEKALKKVFNSGKSERIEFQLPTGIWIDWLLFPEFSAMKKVIAVVTSARDITVRKQMEEAINTSLREKELLLREIHHRVKNNMQVITSLLRLQEGQIRNKQAREMFRESQSRVRTMALVHEKLYQSRDLAKIDFAEYINSLVNGLYQIYKYNVGKITFKIKVEDISLGVDLAVPCGLVVNELISNALKHAFLSPWKGKANIAISLHKLKDGSIELIVRDNGIGIAKGLDIRKTESLGLRLVTILVEGQLQGKIRLNRTKGTKFTIRFKEF